MIVAHTELPYLPQLQRNIEGHASYPSDDEGSYLTALKTLEVFMMTLI